MRACLYQLFDPEVELKALGCDGTGISLMAPKARYYTIKLRQATLREALILKQEALSQGAEAALPYSAVTLQAEKVDLLLMGTERQLEKMCSKLKLQPASLSSLGDEVAEILRRSSRSMPHELHLGRHRLPLGKRTLIMGILNLTPDSFSDGGHYNRVETAVAHAYEMIEEGADIVDIGGESTRPGSKKVGLEEELDRVIPVIKALQSDPNFNTPLSIDTSKAAVARQALQTGVSMVNDVWGLKADPQMASVVAESGVPVCLMHNRTHTEYRDLVPDIITELQESIDLARAAGIEDRQIIIDPGIGFGKDLQQNLTVMNRLRDFRSLGYPILLGTSRKSLIGKTLDLPVDERLEGTAATVAYGIAAGADLVRVHDIREMRRVVQMTDAMVRR
ncbi:MAG: dihydropteroate synthase [Bacillota bacterium]